MSGGSACVGIAAALSKSIVTGLGPVTHTVTVDVRDSTSPKTLTTGPNKICDTGIVTGIPAFTLHRPKLLSGVPVGPRSFYVAMQQAYLHHWMANFAKDARLCLQRLKRIATFILFKLCYNSFMSIGRREETCL